MNKLLLAGIALTAFAGGSALAADMSRPAFRPPAPAELAFHWAGLYLGTHTGVAAGRTTTNNTSPFNGFDAGVPLSYELNPVSIFGGGQIGYNWQFGSYVFGVEIDGGYLGARSFTRPAPDDLVEVEYGWYGTATARAGLAWDRLLSYVKGGAAVARIRNTASDLNGVGAITAADFSEVNATRWGWTIGTGFEYAILPQWTVKSEYLYMDFGTQRSSNLDGDTFEHRNRVHTWKVGLNYRWGGGAPVVARY